MMYHAPAQQSAHDTDDFYRISVVSSGVDVKDAVTPAISVRGKNCISQVWLYNFIMTILFFLICLSHFFKLKFLRSSKPFDLTQDRSTL